MTAPDLTASDIRALATHLLQLATELDRGPRADAVVFDILDDVSRTAADLQRRADDTYEARKAAYLRRQRERVAGLIAKDAEAGR